MSMTNQADQARHPHHCPPDAECPKCGSTEKRYTKGQHGLEVSCDGDGCGWMMGVNRTKP